jgi:von Willebrand factor A domain-containing protein 8
MLLQATTPVSDLDDSGIRVHLSPVEAIEKAVLEVAKYDAGMLVRWPILSKLNITIADDWIVVAITDANFARYNITPEDLQRAMNRDKKVHTALICIGESSEATW